MENRLKHGEALFAEGKIGEAKKIFDDLLKENPENHELLNNLGVISCSQNNVQEAEDYFLRAISAKKDYFNVLLNLSKLYQNTERWEQAANQLEKCISIADQNTDIFNQLGKVYLKIGDTEKAKVTLRKSLELNPDQEIVRESLSALEGDVGAPGKAVEKSPNDQELRELLNNARLQQSPRTKITVLCLPGLQSFLGDIVDFFKTKYDVRTCYSKNNQEIESAVQWADIVWLEWANEMAIHVTNNVPSVSEKQVICRIHSYEVLNGYLPRIQWSKISKTVFVADHVLKIALELCPSISHMTESIVIPNGVNLRNYPFKERKPGFNIGVVGSIDHKKNPVMWIEVLSRLMQIDVRYTLKIAGRIQELRYKYYMKSIVPKLGLTNNIRFFGHVDDVAKWFETNDINYLLTTSPFESFGYSIAEAMAMGYRPLIHAFPSAEEMWPADCVFGCTDELIRLIFDRQSYDSLKYRQFVEKRYSLQSQLEKIEALLKEMADGISSEATFSERRCRNEAHKQWNIPTALARYHRPEKTVIVTGIPRSGTSLFSALLNDIDNAVCLNEILYDVNSLPSAFAEIRRRLIAGESIPNRYDSSGNLATDTQGSGANVQERIVQDVDENAVIGSKINIPYLNQIQKILDYGYKVIAIVRDPVYTIASWNSEKANIIPEAHVADEDMHPRWQRFKFTSDDKIERQAQIWNFYANLIWSLRNKIKIYTYELLTSDMEWVIKDMSEFIGLEPSTNMLETSNQNIESKYPKIEEIKEAVKKYCPVKDVFAYNYLDYEVPAEHGAQHRANTEEDDKKCGQNVLELRY